MQAMLMMRRMAVFMLGTSWHKFVLHKGSDALSVAFNLVAILFFLDVDNLAYAFLLPAADRTLMQKTGRPTIREEEESILLRTKWCFTIGVPLTAPLSLGLSVWWGDDFPGIIVFFSVITFAMAVEALTRKTHGAPGAAMAIEVVVKSLGLFLTFSLLLALGSATGIVSL